MAAGGGKEVVLMDQTSFAQDAVAVAMRDPDRDSLTAMPLGMLPLSTPGLRRARLIKNVHLVGVVEMFADRRAGSGQLPPDTLAREFGWPAGQKHPDDLLIRRLSVLPSYDVYSLRILLKDLDIAVDDPDSLRLSHGRIADLDPFLRDFTRPLIREVYGRDEDAADFDRMLRQFRAPDRNQALTNLRGIAGQLGLPLRAVPDFLESYGDLFLSLAYYKDSLQALSEPVNDFVESLHEIRSHVLLRRDDDLILACDHIQDILDDLVTGTSGRIDAFYRSARNMWHELTVDNFERMATDVHRQQVAIGEVLCGLSVKMNVWRQTFPNRRAGAPDRRAEFIMSQMRSGLDTIRGVTGATFQ